MLLLLTLSFLFVCRGISLGCLLGFLAVVEETPLKNTNIKGIFLLNETIDITLGTII